MSSLSCKLNLTGKYFKLILKKTQFWFETYGNQKTTVFKQFNDWFWNFVMRTRNEEESKICQERCRCTKLVYLILQEVAPRTSCSSMAQRVAVTDWWYSCPMASTFASLCLSQRRTFWTYVVTISLFSLHLMNFMLHAIIDATGVVLRLHYKSIKCYVLFSQGRVCTIFRWGGHFSYMSTKIYSSLQQCKNYKNRSRFSKVMVTNVCHLFMVHSVHFELTVIRNTRVQQGMSD